MMASLTPLHRTWRARVFASTWLSYVGFYFCRKPFSAAKAALSRETGWNATTLGNIWAAYLVAYALGQFLAAAAGTKLGPRRNVLLGMAVSIVVTAAMGVSLSVPVLMGLVAINGLAQATGWSGNVGTMAAWFQRHERGRVMGAWSNCFTVGALSSTWVMAWVLGAHTPDSPAPWRACFYVGALVLSVVWVQFFFFQRNSPADVGLSLLDDGDAAEEHAPSRSALSLGREAWLNIALVSAFYFFAKFIRYAMWSWAAFFLERTYGLTGARANVYATAFDVMGIPGVFLTGWLSDHYFKSRRAGVALGMMLSMTVATALLTTLGGSSVLVFGALLGLVGFTLYGPDALLTSAGAIDIGSRRSATLVAAIISGFGSLGAVVQEVVIARAYDAKHGAVGPLFLLLFGSAAAASICCALLWLRDRRGQHGV
jgi:OPA family glycerol-3-phosphate transporter-like MFS transporter